MAKSILKKTLFLEKSISQKSVRFVEEIKTKVIEKAGNTRFEFKCKTPKTLKSAKQEEKDLLVELIQLESKRLKIDNFFNKHPERPDKAFKIELLNAKESVLIENLFHIRKAITKFLKSAEDKKAKEISSNDIRNAQAIVRHDEKKKMEKNNKEFNENYESFENTEIEKRLTYLQEKRKRLVVQEQQTKQLIQSEEDYNMAILEESSKLCVICDKTFRNHDELFGHYLIHRCQICLKFPGNNEMLKAHMTEHFRQNCGIQISNLFQHQSECQYLKCYFCEKVFEKKHNVLMDYHLLNECKKCPEDFKLKFYPKPQETNEAEEDSELTDLFDTDSDSELTDSFDTDSDFDDSDYEENPDFLEENENMEFEFNEESEKKNIKTEFIKKELEDDEFVKLSDQNPDFDHIKIEQDLKQEIKPFQNDLPVIKEEDFKQETEPFEEDFKLETQNDFTDSDFDDFDYEENPDFLEENENMEIEFEFNEESEKKRKFEIEEKSDKDGEDAQNGKDLNLVSLKDDELDKLDKVIKCPWCLKKISKKTFLQHRGKMHSEVMNRPFKCELCPKVFRKSFKKEIDLSHHQEHAHKNKKSLKCDTCGKEFTQLIQLKNHETDAHKKVQDYKKKQKDETDEQFKQRTCKFCGHVAKNKSSLFNTHVKNSKSCKKLRPKKIVR